MIKVTIKFTLGSANDLPCVPSYLIIVREQQCWLLDDGEHHGDGAQWSLEAEQPGRNSVSTSHLHTSKAVLLQSQILYFLMSTPGNDREMVTMDRMELRGQTSIPAIFDISQAIQEVPGPGKHKHLAGNFDFSLSD